MFLYTIMRPVLVLCALPALAAASELLLDGDVEQLLTISSSDFDRLGRMELEVKAQDGKTVIYSGVKISQILKTANVPIQSDLRGKDVNKYLLAVGADGFVVVFSLPEFDNGRFIIADTINGQPIPPSEGPLQIVSPDEARKARWVKQLTRLSVRTALP